MNKVNKEDAGAFTVSLLKSNEKTCSDLVEALDNDVSEKIFS